MGKKCAKTTKKSPERKVHEIQFALQPRDRIIYV